MMECHIDTGSRDDALHVGLAALSFMKAKIPYKCKEIFILQVLKLIKILFPKIDMSDWISCHVEDVKKLFLFYT